MENIFKTFNKDFFKSVKGITWYDKQGIIQLDENRVVTITFTDLGIRDHFNGYKVEILNKISGSIITKFFKFEDHLTMVHMDNRKYFHVWYYNDNLDWYISRPRNTKEMCDVIMNWINQFK